MEFKSTILTKNGAVTFDAGDPGRELFVSNNPLFKAVENYFDYWAEYADNETLEMYFGSFEELEGSSYLSKRGAIIEGIEAVCNYAYEYKLQRFDTRKLHDMDLDGIFQA